MVGGVNWDQRCSSPPAGQITPQLNHPSSSSHREASRCAILVFEDFHPLITFCHAEQIAPDVCLTLVGEHRTRPLKH